MTSYSYKPASGMDGASTVVALKDGSFLEVRRGEKTHWGTADVRGKWATLEEWKATLPEGATVVKRTTRSSDKKIVSPSEYSADFKTALMAYGPLGTTIPTCHRLVLINNVTEANSHRRRKNTLLGQSKRIHIHIHNNIMREHGRKMLISAAESAEAKAAAILASEPFEYWICSLGYRNPVHVSQTLHAQRVSDGVFVPIFFDMNHGLLHTPDSSDCSGRAIVGTTFGELGIRPVFMIRKSDGLHTVIPAAATGGGSASASP